MVEPEVVIGYRHLVECDFLRVLEEAVRPPNVVQPVDVEDPVLLRHVFRQPQSRVPPALREKYVRHVSLTRIYIQFINNSYLWIWEKKSMLHDLRIYIPWTLR